MGGVEFFKARGDQNFDGLTIEHIVCKLKHNDLAKAIKPRPETRDYFGNLPIYYSIQANDKEII